MKKKSLLFKFVVLLVVCGAIVGLLEAFNLHPEFSCGRFHSIWMGVRHMDFESGTTSVPAGKGKIKIIQRDFDLGPVKVAID